MVSGYDAGTVYHINGIDSGGFCPAETDHGKNQHVTPLCALASCGSQAACPGLCRGKRIQCDEPDAGDRAGKYTDAFRGKGD